MYTKYFIFLHFPRQEIINQSHTMPTKNTHTETRTQTHTHRFVHTTKYTSQWEIIQNDTTNRQFDTIHSCIEDFAMTCLKIV